MNATNFGLLDPMNSNIIPNINNFKNHTYDSINQTTDPTISSSAVGCTNIPSLTRLEEFYAPIHAYLATAICLFGTTTNLLNAVVLTQKQMRNTTNAILTAIAIVDSLTMISSGFHAIYLNFATSPYPENYPHSYVAVQVILFQNVLTIGSHTISTGLLVQLAGFRCWILYSANIKPKTSSGMGSYRSHNSSQKRCVTLGIVIICFIGLMISIPTFFIYTIQQLDILPQTSPSSNQSTEQAFYWFKVRDGAERWEHVHFVLYGCFVKILASILIFILTSFILIAMRTARKRYAKLQSLSSPNNNNNSNNNRSSLNSKVKQRKTSLVPTFKSSIKHQNHNQDNKTNDNMVTMTCHESDMINQKLNAKIDNTTEDRPILPARLSQKNRESQHVTIMLIVVVVSFVITEAPQGVLGTLVAIRGECFHNTVYVPLGDLLDLLVLLNSSINFILYCTMSQLFRQNFTHLVKRVCCSCLVCMNQRHVQQQQQQRISPSVQRPSAVPVRIEICNPATSK